MTAQHRQKEEKISWELNYVGDAAKNKCYLHKGLPKKEYFVQLTKTYKKDMWEKWRHGKSPELNITYQRLFSLHPRRQRESPKAEVGLKDYQETTKVKSINGIIHGLRYFSINDQTMERNNENLKSWHRRINIWLKSDEKRQMIGT